MEMLVPRPPDLSDQSQVSGVGSCLVVVITEQAWTGRSTMEMQNLKFPQMC